MSATQGTRAQRPLSASSSAADARNVRPRSDEVATKTEAKERAIGLDGQSAFVRSTPDSNLFRAGTGATAVKASSSDRTDSAGAQDVRSQTEVKNADGSVYRESLTHKRDAKGNVTETESVQNTDAKGRTQGQTTTYKRDASGREETMKSVWIGEWQPPK